MQTVLDIYSLIMIIRDLFFPFFCHFSCFILTRLVFLFGRSTILIILIFILSVHSTLIFMIVVFNQSFLCDYGPQNRTPDYRNLLIQSVFERFLFIIFFVYFNINYRIFTFRLQCLRNFVIQ